MFRKCSKFHRGTIRGFNLMKTVYGRQPFPLLITPRTSLIAGLSRAKFANRRTLADSWRWCITQCQHQHVLYGNWKATPFLICWGKIVGLTLGKQCQAYRIALKKCFFISLAVQHQLQIYSSPVLKTPIPSSLAKGFAHGPLSPHPWVKKVGTLSETLGQRRWDRGL